MLSSPSPSSSSAGGAGPAGPGAGRGKKLNPASAPFDFLHHSFAHSPPVHHQGPLPPQQYYYPTQPPPYPYYPPYGQLAPPPPLYPSSVANSRFYSPPPILPPPSFHSGPHLFSPPPPPPLDLPLQSHPVDDDPSLGSSKLYRRANPPSPQDALPLEISSRARVPDLYRYAVVEDRSDVVARGGKLVPVQPPAPPPPPPPEPAVAPAGTAPTHTSLPPPTTPKMNGFPVASSTTSEAASSEPVEPSTALTEPSVASAATGGPSSAPSSPIPSAAVSSPPLSPSSPSVPPPKKSWASLFPTPSPSSIVVPSEKPIVPPPKIEEPMLTPRGLYNNGNLCFANAILQVLVWTAPFRVLVEHLASTTKGDLGAVGTERMGTVDSMILFLSQFLSTTPNQTPFRPDLVYASLATNSRFDAMRRGTQEDAEEFLGFFLETLGEEMVELEKKKKAVSAEVEEAKDEGEDGWEAVGSGGKIAKQRSTDTPITPITTIFGGRIRSTLRTPGQKDSITHEPYQRLQLDISPSSIKSIEEALEALFTPERLLDYAAGGATTIKHVVLERLPSVLVCHLKRFWFDANAVGGTGGRVRKLGKRVRFGKELRIRKEWTVEKRGEVVYSLYAVVYHHGNQATGGHYTVAVRTSTKETEAQWVQIDDTNLRPVGFDEVEGEEGEKGAYLLCYMRK